MSDQLSIKGFKILHLNIRSLWRNQDELFMHFGGFDLIALSETWLHSNIPDAIISKSGYSIIRQDRTDSMSTKVKSKGGGLLLYVKDCYYDFVTKISVDTAFPEHLEQLWPSIDIPYRRKFLMGICYRPPSGKACVAINMITDVLDSFDIDVNSDLLLVGDFNINYKKRNSVGFKELKDMERNFLFKQKITTPTRILRVKP